MSLINFSNIRYELSLLHFTTYFFPQDWKLFVMSVKPDVRQQSKRGGLSVFIEEEKRCCKKCTLIGHKILGNNFRKTGRCNISDTLLTRARFTSIKIYDLQCKVLLPSLSSWWIQFTLILTRYFHFQLMTDGYILRRNIYYLTGNVWFLINKLCGWAFSHSIHPYTHYTHTYTNGCLGNIIPN